MALRIVLASIYHESSYHGGNEVYTHNLATALFDLGCEVLYLTSSARYPQCYLTNTFSLTTLTKQPLFSTQLASQVQKFNPNIFHFSGSGLPLVFAAFQLKNFKKIPVVHTYQGPLHPTNLLNHVGATLEQSLITFSANGIITTTPTIDQYVKSKFSTVSSKFIPMSLKSQFLSSNLSPNSSRKKLNLPTDRKIILFVGRLDSNHYYKGVGDLIDALFYLPKDYCLVIVGDGDQKNNYQSKVSNLNLSSNVIFAGDINENELVHYYSSCDVFVLPSTSNSEGFGLVLIEAMATFKPVITTTVIGSYDWLNREKVATFIPPFNPHALADSIQNTVSKPNTETLNKAQAFAKTFNPKNMAQKTVEFYNSLLS